MSQIRASGDSRSVAGTNNGVSPSNSGPVAGINGTVDFWDKEQAALYEKWAKTFEAVTDSFNNPYFDYFYSGQDIQIKIEGVDEVLPIYSFGYVIEQKKQPIYGFWDYCVDEKTEALTKRGWLHGNEITEDDIILSVDQQGNLQWSKIKSIYRNPNYDGLMFKLSAYRAIDALVTPGHKFMLEDNTLKEIEDINRVDTLRIMGCDVDDSEPTVDDDFVVMLSIFLAHGRIDRDRNKVIIELDEPNQILQDALDQAQWIKADYPYNGHGIKFVIDNNAHPDLITHLDDVAPNKVLSLDFINELNASQRYLLIDLCSFEFGWITKSKDIIDAYQYLAARAGCHSKVFRNSLSEYQIDAKFDRKTIEFSRVNMDGYGDPRRKEKNQPTIKYEGLVWCPETEYGTFICRRNGMVYVTGNTYSGMLRGTRIVSGAFTLVTSGPNYLVSKIAKAATFRASTASKPPPNFNAIRGLDQNEALIDTYWRRHYDYNLDTNQQHLFSIHPPFNFVIRYGIQETSLTMDNPNLRIEELRNRYGNAPALFTDYNERLVRNTLPDLENTILIENIEILNKSVQYDSEGNPLFETYSFIARDERLLGKQSYTKTLPTVEEPERISSKPGGGGRTVNHYK